MCTYPQVNKKVYKKSPGKEIFSDFEARVGVEPTNDSFANCSVRPLRHRALSAKGILAYIN